MAFKAKNVAGTAADPVLQFAKLELDGETYRLAYSFNAIAEAEYLAGCNLLNGLTDFRNASALQLRGLLYAALSVADKKVTVSQAGDLVRLDTVVAITAALLEAYRLSMREVTKQDPPAAAPPAQS